LDDPSADSGCLGLCNDSGPSRFCCSTQPLRPETDLFGPLNRARGIASEPGAGKFLGGRSPPSGKRIEFGDRLGCRRPESSGHRGVALTGDSRPVPGRLAEVSKRVRGLASRCRPGAVATM